MDNTPSKGTILVVEDNLDFREYLVELLKLSGYKTLIADDGAQAHAQFRIRKPDLVLTDLVMPQRDGAELIYQIREREPDKPIIAMSGGYSGAEKNLETANALGANRVLGKPFTSAQLLEVIQELLGEIVD
jgi:CheY-like chemotaxis protein